MKRIIVLFAVVVSAFAVIAVNRGYCRVRDDGKSVTYAPDYIWPSPRTPTADDYLGAGWLRNSIVPPAPPHGMMVTNTTYAVASNSVVAVYAYGPMPPRVRRWTPLSIKRSAVKLGHWDALKDLLTAANAYDDFIMAQYEAEDDPDFIRLTVAARAQLGDAVVDAVLDGAEEE